MGSIRCSFGVDCRSNGWNGPCVSDCESGTKGGPLQYVPRADGLVGLKVRLRGLGESCWDSLQKFRLKVGRTGFVLKHLREIPSWESSRTETSASEAAAMGVGRAPLDGIVVEGGRTSDKGVDCLDKFVSDVTSGGWAESTCADVIVGATGVGFATQILEEEGLPPIGPFCRWWPFELPASNGPEGPEVVPT